MPINAIKEAATTAIDSGKNILVSTTTAVSNGVNNLVNGLNSIVSNAQKGLTNAGADILSGAVGVAANRAQNALNDFVGPIAQKAALATPKINIARKPPFRNILHEYASYNYIITLFVVDMDSYNFATYRQGYEGSVLLKSGSGSPENRVQTAYGKYDFFIDDLEIKSTVGGSIAVGNAEACEMSFKVIEPYSMGLFMQSLEIAAADNGYKNYLEAPIIMKIEFKGHLNDTQQGVDANELSIEKTTKYFALRQSEVGMKVTSKGAEYNFTTTATNLVAMTTVYSELKTDVSIEGATVHEILQTGDRSLQRVLNDKLKETAKTAGIEPDKIIIHFPSNLSFPSTDIANFFESSATIDPKKAAAPTESVEAALKVAVGKNETLVQQESSINVIGQSSMGFDFIRPADQPFAKDKDAYNSETQTVDRSKINVKPNIGVLRFSQGMNIQHVINQVILISNYCKNALKPEQITEDGKIPYWKIDTQVFYLNSSANLTKKGVVPKLIVYRVVPYRKDASVLLPPNSPNPWSEAMARTVLKEYDYIYTGKNLDVLNFDIQYNAGFYTSMNADLNKNSDSILMQKQTSNTPEDQYSVSQTPPGGSTPTTDNLPTSAMHDNIKTSTGNRGGTSIDTPATLAARSMHDILYHSPELNTLDLTILGDPFYLGDSGIGNYFAKESNYSEMNADHAMNNQYGDVRISITFRTPLDLDPSIGAYTFGPNRMVNRFSGIYTVTEVTSKFSKGKFTQHLVGTRVNGQTLFNGQILGTAGLAKLVVPTASETIADIFNTAIRYETSVGSEQTRLLAEQDAGFFDN
jgi:hypothetical protein